MTPIAWIASATVGSIFGLLLILVIHNFRMQELRRRIQALESRLTHHTDWHPARHAVYTAASQPEGNAP